MNCGECDIISLYFMCCSDNGSVYLVCCVFDSVWELFGETIRNLLGVEVFSVGGGALLDRMCMVFPRMGVVCM